MLFYIISGLIIVASLLVVTRANPLASALWLVVTLFLQAILFVIMGAHLVAGLQILLYAGAIMVLILFVIMLLNLSPKKMKWRSLTGARIVIASAIIYFIGVMALALWFLAGRIGNGPQTDMAGNVENVGKLLLTKYAVPFELLSVLLIVAILGAVVTSRKNHHLS